MPNCIVPDMDLYASIGIVSSLPNGLRVAKICIAIPAITPHAHTTHRVALFVRFCVTVRHYYYFFLLSRCFVSAMMGPHCQAHSRLIQFLFWCHCVPEVMNRDGIVAIMTHWEWHIMCVCILGIGIEFESNACLRFLYGMEQIF